MEPNPEYLINELVKVKCLSFGIKIESNDDRDPITGRFEIAFESFKRLSVIQRQLLAPLIHSEVKFHKDMYVYRLKEPDEINPIDLLINLN